LFLLLLLFLPSVVVDALLVGATPSQLIAAYVEHGVTCGAICIDTTVIRFARALNIASAERVRVLLAVLLRAAPALGRVHANDDGGESVSVRFVERCAALGELFVALLRTQSAELTAAECVAAALQLASERSVVILMAAGAHVVAPHARDALLRALPHDSTLRRLWTVRDDEDNDSDDASTASTSLSSSLSLQPLATRVALRELCPFSPATQSVVLTTPTMSWRDVAPPAALTFVLDRLMCRIVATDELPVDLIARDLDAAHALSHLPLATFHSFVVERMLESYRKTTTAATLALVLDVFEAACSASDAQCRVFYGVACEQFVTPPAADVATVTWPETHAYIVSELSLVGASSLQVGRTAAPSAPPSAFQATREWFTTASIATEHGVPLGARCVDDWVAWLDGDGVQQLGYDDARTAQMALLTCVAADSSKRCALADAVVAQVRRAVDTNFATSGVMLSLLANAAADTPLYELLRQAFRMRQLVEALTVVCNTLGNDTGPPNDAMVDNGADGKRRRVDSSSIWSRFSDAFLLLYRLHARAVDDSYAGAFTMVRGVERWNAAFRAASPPNGVLDTSRMSVAVWARATAFHVPMWEVKDAVDAGLAATLTKSTDATVRFLFAPREFQAVGSMPSLSPWSMLLAVPAVMEQCVVQLATGAFEAPDVAARVDHLCQRCPCLMPAVVSWLADAALVRTNRWLPLAPDSAAAAAAEPQRDQHGRSVPTQPPHIPQTRLLGELNNFHVASMMAALVVLSTSPTGALMRRISVNWPWKPLLRARQRLDETQTLALSTACGRRGLSPSQSVVAAKATAGIDPSVIRLFNTWFITRADTGLRWVRVGWVGDVLVTCRAAARGSSPRVVADFLITELCKNVVSQSFSTRQQTAWFADFTGVVLCNLSRESLCEWIEVAVPSLVDRSNVAAALPLVARALCVACVLSDADARQSTSAPTVAACAVLARVAIESFIELPTNGRGGGWRTDFPVSNRDQVARVLLSEFVLGGTHGALMYCDAPTRSRLLRCALAVQLDAVSVCRLFAACDALNGTKRSPEATVRHTFTLLHCLPT
jgi:hypothetical protein